MAQPEIKALWPRDARAPTSLRERGIVVVIPTYQRDLSLSSLLSALSHEQEGSFVHVIVGDNACAASTRKLVDDYRLSGLPVQYLPVPERGVAQVRNALVHHASTQWDDWAWIVMFDDDGVPSPGCAQKLVDVGWQLRAHLVGGPVLGFLPDDANILARNSIFASRKRWATGLVDLLNTTQNLAIARDLIDQLGDRLFETRYGASGGEDYDLFRRVAGAGGRLAWCDEAVTHEPAPPDRLTLRAVADRYVTTGMYMAVIDRNYDGLFSSVKTAVKGSIRSALSICSGMMRRQPDDCARGALGLCHYGGRVLGLMGGSSTRYVSEAPA
ncbi:MAG: hypothetical protein JWN04_509 [Myxococcaceae bacterium]|nr:hypothetical protein [Myxococcaceae bacterium]